MPKHSGNDTRVLVYGTLKHSHGNHRILRRPDSTFLGYHLLRGVPGGRIVSLGAFPAIVVNKNEADWPLPVLCECYHVSEETLFAMDVLEGHRNREEDSFYHRTKVDTPWGKAWVYVMAQNINFGFEDITPCGRAWAPSEEEIEFLRAFDGAEEAGESGENTSISEEGKENQDGGHSAEMDSASAK